MIAGWNAKGGHAMRYLIVMLLAAGLVHGQPVVPNTPGMQSPYDAKAKRAAREAVVKKLGPSSRDFIEAHGEPAVAACNACSPAGGTKLASFHASGDLDRLPAPAQLLAVIGNFRGGDDVVHFAVAHVDELQDRERFNVFLADPMTFSLSLKSLDRGVAESRLQAEQFRQQTERQAHDHLIGQYVGGGIALLVLLGIWQYRRSSNM